MKRYALTAIALVALMGAALGVASAHAKIDHCTPAVDSTVASAPAQVVCVMSEEIDTKLSTMKVFDSSGTEVDKNDAHVDLEDPDHKTLVVSLDQSRMQEGTFTVKYHTVTPGDNGVTDESFTVAIASASSRTAASSQATAVTTTALPVGAAAAGTATPSQPVTVPTTGAALSRSLVIDAGLLIAFALISAGMILQLRHR